MEVFLGVIIGVLLTAGVIMYFKFQQSKKLTNTQSVILLDKIKSVCKFITVEGDFAEIYHYEDVKQKFLKLITSKKKALVVVNAKAYVGFDLAKVLHQNLQEPSLLQKAAHEQPRFPKQFR